MIATAESASAWRTTLGMAMAMIAVAAAMLGSALDKNSPLGGLISLTVSLALPVRLLVRFRHCSVTEDLAPAALAMAYLAWGATVNFSPGRAPDGWFVLDVIHRQGGFDVRWNWGMLAVFYAVILASNTGPHAWRWLRRGAFGGPRRPLNMLRCHAPRRWRIASGAEFVFALWFFASWLHGSRYFGPAMSGWLCPIGLAGSLTLAIVKWRPWSSKWRLPRFALRVAGLAPTAVAGIIAGLAWSQWGWQVSVRIAAVFVGLVVVLTRLSIYRHHERTHLRFARLSGRRWCGRVMVHLLAMLWGFAISAEIIQTPIGVVYT